MLSAGRWRWWSVVDRVDSGAGHAAAAEKRREDPFVVVLDAVIGEDGIAVALASDADERDAIGLNFGVELVLGIVGVLGPRVKGVHQNERVAVEERRRIRRQQAVVVGLDSFGECRDDFRLGLYQPPFPVRA